MALDVTKLRRVSVLYGEGEKRHYRHAYYTDDSSAAVQTNGYFDAAAEHFTEGAGDVIDIRLTASTVPQLRTYLVTRTGGDIALTLSVATSAA